MPRPPIDLTGRQFDRLHVDERAPASPKAHPWWRCTCRCGRTISVPGARLRSGGTRSCGCLRREAALANLTRNNGFDVSPKEVPDA